jgi:hypothetical protein
MYDKLKKYLPHNKAGFTEHYFGFEFDPSVVMHFLLKDARPSRTGDATAPLERPKLPFTVYFGNAYTDLPVILGERSIGAFMLDTTHGINEGYWDRYCGILGDIVERATKQVPLFVLGLNYTLDRGHDRGVPVAGRLKFLTASLVRTFTKWGLKTHQLLPTGEVMGRLEEVVPNPLASDVEGRWIQARGFDIYRSMDEEGKARRLRMISARIAFDSKRRCTYVYEHRST